MIEGKHSWLNFANSSSRFMQAVLIFLRTIIRNWCAFSFFIFWSEGRQREFFFVYYVCMPMDEMELTDIRVARNMKGWHMPKYKEERDK